jgi:hypothetical protein
MDDDTPQAFTGGPYGSGAYRQIMKQEATSVDALLVVLCRVQVLMNGLDQMPGSELFGAGQALAGVSVTVLQDLATGDLRVEIAPDP